MKKPTGLDLLKSYDNFTNEIANLSHLLKDYPPERFPPSLSKLVPENSILFTRLKLYPYPNLYKYPQILIAIAEGYHVKKLNSVFRIVNMYSGEVYSGFTAEADTITMWEGLLARKDYEHNLNSLLAACFICVSRYNLIFALSGNVLRFEQGLYPHHSVEYLNNIIYVLLIKYLQNLFKDAIKESKIHL